ncbi:uncharacterized protein PODANS_6_9910 [Podospora anserina S mat+]|uniref:Podospora anserina S mat+ genomic DNA chromosome 6, supercontig 4 n=3 Tax=Podospora TaxID=5144 RepID=B2ANS2_PODAN|nr:uncharacterized protein PODANS_6_9910 [Podospora anserina S mat+]KAK4663611.1 hypothetical protein QC763_609910 [Podospora pseudopauciseta]KAK4671922.1 hypothetical protein QC764_609910 [Podospora pseudoanserina]CAP65494.1 unnamed protein product [Podospora anserina S mat+]CDP31489.1 Putative Protein SNA2 [Podospora anserina S mat+]
MCSTDLFLGILAILFPPLPVWVKRGICSADSLINILLLCLGFIPGLIHAWYIIAKYPDIPYDYDYQAPSNAEHGRVYVFVHDNNHRQGHPHQGQPRLQNQQPKAHPQPNYGTTAHNNNNHSSGHEEGVAPAAGPSSGGPPPSYAQVVAQGPGDHKVQTQD